MGQSAKLKATLIGSRRIRIGGGPNYTFAEKEAGGYGGVMPAAARMLLKEGLDHRSLVQLDRQGTRFHDASRTLGEWAALGGSDEP